MISDRQKMMFGFCILLVLTVLAAVIALGHVEEKTSFGLSFVLGALSSLNGAFANWAFSSTKSEPAHETATRS
jgi:hypothetical protein